jgi:hypothetical protein
VLENRVLRKIFGPNKEEVSGGWRRMHNEELHKFYISTNIIREIKSKKIIWAGYVARIREKRSAYKILVEKPERKRPLGRSRRMCENNIKMDLREVG